VTSFLAGKKQTPTVFAVLCDGIGGHRAGEIAAEMGVSMITDRVTVSDPDLPLEALREAIIIASDEIYEASQTNEKFQGMGATCACTWVIGDQLYTANMGDSRIYLLRDEHLVQLTTDHTWVQEALDSGVIDDENRAQHPNAHIIRRYLGSPKTPEPDFRLWFFADEKDDEALKNQGLKVVPGDVLLLCSDGLTDLVSDQEIRDVIQSNPLQKVPNLLIGMANSRGGYDNTTVVLLKSPTPEGRSIINRRWLTHCLAVGIFLVALVIVVFLAISYLTRRGPTEIEPSATVTMPAPSDTAGLSETAIPSETPEVAETMTPTPGEAFPQFTITPWPTHTPAP
jgi:protein phosphatase